MPERKPLEQRFSALKGEATTWIPAWREIRNYVNPTRGRFAGDLPNRGKLIDHKLILDSHPQRALEKLADGLAASRTSPSRPWWRPTIDDLGRTMLGCLAAARWAFQYAHLEPSVEDVRCAGVAIFIAALDDRCTLPAATDLPETDADVADPTIPFPGRPEEGGRNMEEEDLPFGPTYH